MGLVNDWNVRHPEGRRFAIRAERQPIRWHRCNPIQAFRRDGRMEVMDLVRRDRRSLEDGESCVREDSLIRLACCPVLACHVAVIRSRGAPSQTVAFVICSHAVKAAAASQLSLEVIDARELHIRSSGLVVIAILVEPGNRVGT